MQLELDDTEVRLLDEVLGTQLRSLLNEIAHTDDREFRQQLRVRHERLDAIHHRLVRGGAAKS